MEGKKRTAPDDLAAVKRASREAMIAEGVVMDSGVEVDDMMVLVLVTVMGRRGRWRWVG